MLSVPEFRHWFGTNSLSWRVRNYKAWVQPLQFYKLLKQSVEFRVGNDRIIQYVVTMLMEGDVVPEPGNTVNDIRWRIHRLD